MQAVLRNTVRPAMAEVAPTLLHPANMAGGPTLKPEGKASRVGLAGEYHSCDFSWEELRREVEPLMQQQAELGRVRLAQATTDRATQHGVSQLPTLQEARLSQEAELPSDSATGQPLARRTRRRQQQPAASSTGQQQQQGQQPLRMAVAPDTSQQGQGDVYDGNKWDEFYASTARTAKFFKERRYLLLEFPVLATQQAQHVVELGCGYGASLLPVLRHNPNVTVTATDIAPTCVAQLHEVAAREGIQGHQQRITSFVADSADPAARHLFQNLHADVALIMFTLSAVPPEGQAAMLENAWASLRPGGVLCIRDHGLYDMVQLRIPSEQWVGPNMYLRGDGTLAYFFSLEDISGKAEAAGFSVEECQYVTVYNKNRKTGQTLRRVFVHSVFRKPDLQHHAQQSDS